jgi:hypothetical protein
VTRERFGVFSPVLQSSDGYLALLHLDSPEAIHAVSSVVKCCETSATAHSEIIRLLDESNWRPHLVAAVAVSAQEHDHTSMARLWATFDSGSWVRPQLAVAAYLRDPNFLELAKVRILARCPFEPSKLTSMTPLERHSAAGPGGVRARSGKAAASLVRLVSLLRPSPEWLATELSSPDLAALFAEDIDLSAQIAETWLAKLENLLRELKIPKVNSC